MRPRALSSLALLVALASCVSVDSPPIASSEEGFVPLFDGSSLAGWIYGTAGGEPLRSGNGYQAEDGVLSCTKEDGGNLYTEKEYGDFVFRFEFRLTPNANNGIGIRAPLEGDAAYAGMEVQVLDDGGSEYRSLQPWQYHGSIYGVVAAERGHQRPVGEWNEEEISARGRRVTVKLNGAVIVDAWLDDVKDPEILAKHPGLARERGHLGFLGHGAHVDFRNLRIREL